MSEITKEEVERITHLEERGGDSALFSDYYNLSDVVVKEANVVNSYFGTPKVYEGLKFGEGLPTFAIERRGREFFVDGEYVGYGTTAGDFTLSGAMKIYEGFCNEGGME